MLFTGQKCVTLEKLQCLVSPPYIFSRFLETFTPINELWRLESVRRHEVNTLYVSPHTFFTFFGNFYPYSMIQWYKVMVRNSHITRPGLA
jgi:hypothetical protein